MGCPGGHEHDPINAEHFCALFGPIFLYIFLVNDCNGKKKVVVSCLDVIVIAFFPRNIQ